ncbi:MAG: excinuclease ABC subunit UvrA [Alphaproteobacteria bacterium]
MHNIISIRGARTHNLKNIDLDIPRNQLVVITGLSGSGKSSLAFDTLYAEGQRRYVESLSAYARQFLDMMEKPDVDSIDGLSPAISIEQKTTSRNPRSTVGTVTEIHDYLRLFYARVGTPYSPATGLPIESQTISQMVDRLLELPEGTKIYLLAPLVRGRKGEYKKDLQELQRKGFQRVRINGEFYDIEDAPTLNKKLKHDIEVVVDRLAINPEVATRLAESMETALHLADGLIYVDELASDNSPAKRHVFSSKFACPVSGFTLSEIEPRLFSFNNPHGACPVCDGLGIKVYFDPQLVIPDESLSLRDGAIAPWSGTTSNWYWQVIDSLARHFKISLHEPWGMLPKRVREVILFGSGTDNIPLVFDDGIRRYTTEKPFEGVMHNLERRWKETESPSVRDELSRYQSDNPCEACHGYRLKPEALTVKIHGLHIGEVAQLSLEKAELWIKAAEDSLSPQKKTIANRIVREISTRLGFLNAVGLDYLSLARGSGTLSGGESQRIRLASQIGSGLTGVMYVLDEPSIGLHQRDNDRLLETLKKLRDLGNSVIVVEHDEDAIRAADWLVDMGEGAGVHGGKVVASGPPQELLKNPNSLTLQYLSGAKSIAVPALRRAGKNGEKLVLTGAKGNNLQQVTMEVPLGMFVCVTGVSGSGKSTLTLETLYKILARELNGSREHPAAYNKIEGLSCLDKVIDIDQSPIGRTPRSNPATYTGAFTPMREWFAGLPESKARGYGPGRFSFNVKGGRCEACQGDGVLKIEMHFLPDVYVTCDSCKGKRYNRETLDITWRGKNIAEILAMTVEEGLEFFQAVPSVREKLRALSEVGLGYIAIGQAATTLSGGEAQRVKLSKELAKRATGRTLYILDEPTTGLHFEDINTLLQVLHRLVDQGNTVLVIEHNLEVIKTADWVIDLGPEGGNKGGYIVATGRPEDVAANPRSHTGRYLAPYLAVKTPPKKKAG